jgi:hypothetical protein
MYLLVSQHVSGIIMPIIRRTVQSRQRLMVYSKLSNLLHYDQVCVLLRTYTIPYILTHLLNQPPSNNPPPPQTNNTHKPTAHTMLHTYKYRH